VKKLKAYRHLYIGFLQFNRQLTGGLKKGFLATKSSLRNISIARKLYFTIGIMAFTVVVEISTLLLAVNTLSAVRSFVAGEGLWSKAQKDAVLYLHFYEKTHDKADYIKFKRLLQIPAGDKLARLELLKSEPNLAVARVGFYAGRNHSEDIDGMIKLVQRFGSTYYLNRAFIQWSKGEPMIAELSAIGEQMHDEIATGAPQSAIDKTLDRVGPLNRQLTVLENEFSSTLGEGARWLEGMVLNILIALSVTICGISVFVTVSVNRGIAKGLNAILQGADLISKGIFSRRVRVYSEDEIGVLATSFNQMTDELEQNSIEIRDNAIKLKNERDRAEASEKVKQLFLMNMSHELRTPMNVILGFAHLLEGSPGEKERDEYVQLLIRAGEDLLAILNDIIDFSRMEEGEVQLECMPFKPTDMVRQMIGELHTKATAKNIVLSSYVDERIPHVLLGDAKRLKRVLQNLLSNALKFTNEGEVEIAIHLKRSRQHYVELEFLVKDTGIGIADEHFHKIFERFVQADNSTERKFGGTGIGLSIVKQLVELQGGKVNVESTLGEGSKFSFVLSFLKAKKSPAKLSIGKKELALPEPLPVEEHGPRVLIVDDNPMNRLLVNKILLKKNFHTDAAENGKIAVAKHTGNDYDVILMDLQMPEMDGYEATKVIRAMPGCKSQIPIIAMTAHAMDGEKERCLSIGMSAFLPKPFSVDELFENINELLKQKATK